MRPESPSLPGPSLSIVIPFFNEEASLPELHRALLAALGDRPTSATEIILVDDGSHDGSWDAACRLAEADAGRTLALRLRRNFGKSAALNIGFTHASGEVVITMDADLQDDPAEIPALLAKLAEGYDLVSGWKQHRQDPLGKTLPSKLFNAVTSFVTGIPLHDFNCGFKAYRSIVVRNISLYGELHRYIPVLAHDLGFRMAEVPVRHHARRWGRSKFGFRRFTHGLLDLATVLVITRYLKRPAHLLGGLALLIGGIGIAVLLYLSVLWFAGLGPIGHRPLLFFGILCVTVATQLLTMGLIAELMVRGAAPSPVDRMVRESRGRGLASESR